MLHKAKKMNPNALVVAAGCYVQAAVGNQELSEEVETWKKNGIDLIVGNDKKNQIVEIIRERQNAIEDINDTKMKRKFEELEIETMEEHTRAYMKIQDGCNQFCTYCIIPYARGRVRSRGMEEIKKEAMRLVQSGYQEIVLTGIHLSSYGVDLEEPLTLLDVIVQLGEIPGIQRIRLGSLEPRIITEPFMEAVSKISSFCPQFHLSLQSGCDETLKRMNRKYTTGEYLEGCNLIRKYFPNAAITTDIIVGFPGETEEEFEQTMEFAKTVQFSKIHVFKYSKREGTKAAAMKQQVPEPVKTKRSNQLQELEQQMRTDYMKQLIGEQKEVLLEEAVLIDGERYWVGHTKEYVKVAVPYQEKLVENTLVNLQVSDLLGSEVVVGEVCIK
jgi:threonylcarbamoyladenosine tRNA methylthiotransferase MtaB